MIDQKQSFRKGAVIVEINVEHGERGNTDPIITRTVTDYTTINKAKRANRLLRYRVIPHGLRRKVNGVWVRS